MTKFVVKKLGKACYALKCFCCKINQTLKLLIIFQTEQHVQLIHRHLSFYYKKTFFQNSCRHFFCTPIQTIKFLNPKLSSSLQTCWNLSWSKHCYADARLRTSSRISVLILTRNFLPKKPAIRNGRLESRWRMRNYFKIIDLHVGVGVSQQVSLS